MSVPTANPNAVAPTEGMGGPVIRVDSLAGRDDVERVETVIQLPAGFQYVIPGRKKVGSQWVDDNKVGITSDGYDYINRVLGVSFHLPDWVPDQTGELVRNPIHRGDYIYIRMGAVWYNEAGQLVGATEDLEVDFRQLYVAERVNSYDSAPVTDPATGAQLFDERGDPLMKLKDADAERKATKALVQLRTMGMRYAQTVLRTRLMKVAVGIKSLPIQQPKPFNLRVVGFRDKMAPLDRVAATQESLGRLFGGSVAGAQPLAAQHPAAAPPDAPDERMAEPLTAQQLLDIEGVDPESAIEQVVASATGLIAPNPSTAATEAAPTDPDEFDLPEDAR